MAVVPIASTPPLISAVAVQYFTNVNQFVGPWSAGGSLYCVLGEATGGIVLHILKSIDGGLTWASQDIGNEQTFFIAGQQSAFQPNTITLFFTNVPSGDSDAFPFDTATDTYGTIEVVTESGGVHSGAYAQPRSDGSIVYLTNQAPGGAAGVLITGHIFNVIFGSGFTVDSETGGGLQSVVTRNQAVDSSDVTHILTLFRNDDLSVQETRYVTIDAADNVSAAVVIDSDTANLGLCDQSIAFAGNLAFPFSDLTSGFARAKIFYGVGATSDPNDASWSVIDVWTSGLDADSVDGPIFSILDTNGDLLIFWANTTAAGISRVWFARFNGSSFNAPELFYDSSLFPPAGATQDPAINFGLSIAVVGGQFVGVVSMDIDGTGNQTFYLSNGGAVAGYFHSMY